MAVFQKLEIRMTIFKEELPKILAAGSDHLQVLWVILQVLGVNICPGHWLGRDDYANCEEIFWTQKVGGVSVSLQHFSDLHMCYKWLKSIFRHIYTAHSSKRKNDLFVETAWNVILFSCCATKRPNSAKIIRRFYSKITGNKVAVHFPLFLQAPVNIFRNQAQYGSKGQVLFFF